MRTTVYWKTYSAGTLGYAVRVGGQVHIVGFPWQALTDSDWFRKVIAGGAKP